MKRITSARNGRHGSKGIRIAKYSIFTVLLTCLIVTGYYLISNGVIFGKFEVRPDTYKMGEVSETDQSKIVVTPQNQEGAVPLTSTNENLPKIPALNKDAKKGSKENPFVVLEIVPEFSQQTLSYMVDSQEKGLPFNPVQLGATWCNEKSDSNGFLNGDHKTINTGNIQNIVPNTYGYFGNEFSTGIEIADGSRLPYYEIKFLYELKLDSTEISEDDFKNRTVNQLYQENKAAFAIAAPDKFSTVTDAEGNVTEATCTDSCFQAALEEKNRDGAYTDRNWVKEIKENDDITKSHKITISADSGLTEEDFNSLTMAQLKEKYPELFAKDDNGREITDAELKKDGKWVKEKKQLEERKKEGYFIKREPGKGRYTLTGSLSDTYNGVTARTTHTNTDMWDYVEGEPPQGALEYDTLYQSWDVNNHFTDDTNIGSYIKCSYSRMDYNQWSYWEDNSHAVKVVEDVYLFEYARYVYTLKYVGMKINDILKYSLFTRDTQEEYEELNLQVIVVTPDMINEMDANDTENTLDYIERADLFYISEYYDGYELMATNLEQFVDFYNLYCGGSGEKLNGDKSKLKSFLDTDLEWWDCLKIIKRLSVNQNLPLMSSKFLGAAAMRGVDNQINTQIYIDKDNKAVDTKGTLNNLCKMFFITVQFDLLDIKKGDEANVPAGNPSYRRTFMDDIFPKLKTMKLNPDQQDSSAHPAKYTGYYERVPLAESNMDQAYKERCYYLWNKFTFLPTELTGIYKSQDSKDPETGDYDGMTATLINKYGYLPSYFYDNTFQNDGTGEANRGGASANGSDGLDDKNVTFAGDGKNDDINMSIPTNVGTVDRMLEILRNILDNDDKSPLPLAVNLLENKKDYSRMKNDQVLLDYVSDANYKDGNKKINLKFIFANQNNEDAVIRKISLVKEEEATTGVTVPLNDDKHEDVAKEPVTYSSGDPDPINGYKIPAEDTSTIHFVPVKRSDWQAGYNILKIQWTTRMHFIKKNKTKNFNRTGTSYVYIGERGLFNLE